MTRPEWRWKNKDGAQGGLLYDSGNWGDILKMLWLAEIIRWKQRSGPPAAYTDPFAGDVAYPLGKKWTFRLAECQLPRLDFLQKPFIDKGLWPSAAAGAALLATGGMEVWDIDPGRREAWRNAGIPLSVPEDAASGWDLVARAGTGLLLIDPYDFLAEWRERLPLVLEKSFHVSTLLYVYNRSGKSGEKFAEYRRFRGALEDSAGDRPKRVGRVAADAFLPDSFHEMVFLPCAADAARADFPALSDNLKNCAVRLHEAQTATNIFDC